MSIILAFALALLSPAAGAMPSMFEGPVRVIDGDTVVLDGRSLRLAVVDTPERTQTCDVNGKVERCGEAARWMLETMIGDQPLRCEYRGKQSYKRPVVMCQLAGQNLSALLLSAGMGRIDPRYLHEWPDHADVLLAAESRAKAARLGLWAGQSQRPAVYRDGFKAAPVKQLKQCPPERPVKGNYNPNKNTKIYHEPGSTYYDRTGVGHPNDRCFASRADAEADGFRRPLR